MKLPLNIKVKDARESQGLTQQELADRMGVSQAYIGKIESGKVNPSLKTLNKLSDALRVDPKFFLEEGKGVFFDEYKDELTLEENQFIKDQKFRPWITLAAECDKEGLTPDTVRNLIQMVMELSKNKKAP